MSANRNKNAALYQARRIVFYCDSPEERAVIEAHAKAWAERQGITARNVVSRYCRLVVREKCGIERS